MKRYLVFGGKMFRQLGGFDDFVKDYDKQDDAIEMAEIQAYGSFRWSHVYDTKEQKQIFNLYKH